MNRWTYDYDTPNWAPLEALSPADGLGDWMWMRRCTDAEGKVIESYKHRVTRSYIHLDHHGNAWNFEWVSMHCDPWCDEDHDHGQDVTKAVQAPAADAIAEALR